MANVVFSRKEFEKYITLTEEVQHKISMFGTTLESINDKELELEITPDRPDLLSMQGYVRAFKAFLGEKPGLKEYTIHEPAKDYKVIVDSSVKDVRPFTACAIVKGIAFDNEKIKDIVNFQEKVHNTLGRQRKKSAIGIYPLDKITLPITYEARAPEKIVFTPLEAKRPMNARQILRNHPTGKEYAHLLDDYKKYPVFVDAAGSILSMPPVINSHETGKVQASTKDVFVECSGHDKETQERTLNILVTALAEMGGEIYAMHVSDGITPSLKPTTTKLSLENVTKTLGFSLNEKEVEKLLARMGHEYHNGVVKSPAWRVDILHEVDLIEDIAVAYGYDNLTPVMPNISTTGQEDRDSVLRRKLADVLVGLGMHEVSSYHLVKPDELKRWKVTHAVSLVETKSEYKSLRPNLSIPLMRILGENKDTEYPQNVFEIGTVFGKDGSSTVGVKEKESCCIALCPANFTKAKQVLDALFTSLGKEYSLHETTSVGLIDGRAGSIHYEGNTIGTLGEVHPTTLRNWGIKMPLALIEFDVEELYKTL